VKSPPPAKAAEPVNVSAAATVVMASLMIRILSLIVMRTVRLERLRRGLASVPFGVAG
jgi:hypothetical protein